VLPVPLLEPDPDAALDLGATVTAVYEQGAYARLIDYRRPPSGPGLSNDEEVRLDRLLREQGIR
jgi:hypothetical protein